MSWADRHIQALKAGQVTQCRPHGGSMRGRIESGQLVTLAPVTGSDIHVGDVILVQWKNNYLLQLVLRVERDQFLIGNNLGKVNGWVPPTALCGKVTAVED